MKLRKVLLIAAAVVALTVGSVTLGLRGQAGADACGTQNQTAVACARCGDGVCARSCENERTCPADCKSTSTETEKTVAETSATEPATN